MKKKRKRPALVAGAENRAEAGTESGGEVRAGDVVVRRPLTFCGTGEGFSSRPMSGRVVYIHPRGRFHLVEFVFPNGARLRECFPGLDR